MDQSRASAASIAIPRVQAPVRSFLGSREHCHGAARCPQSTQRRQTRPRSLRITLHRQRSGKVLARRPFAAGAPAQAFASLCSRAPKREALALPIGDRHCPPRAFPDARDARIAPMSGSPSTRSETDDRRRVEPRGCENLSRRCRPNRTIGTGKTIRFRSAVPLLCRRPRWQQYLVAGEASERVIPGI